MRLFVFILITTALTSCASNPLKNRVRLSEKMLPDGKTWQIKAELSCEERQTDSKKCREKIQAAINDHAQHLCDKKVSRVFNCAERGSPDLTAIGVCYATCGN